MAPFNNTINSKNLFLLEFILFCWIILTLSEKKESLHSRKERINI